MLRRLTALTIVAAMGLSVPAMGQDAPERKAPGKKQQDAGRATLKVGDAAPKLSVEDFVKGERIAELEKGKVYVVEFWATWCPPCVKSIPHLTDLQREYKDKGVVVIGVAGNERGSDSAASLEGVRKFVKKKGKEMEYTVAYDADRTMSNDWMRPAQQNGIPCAFVVDKEGKIAWIGNPLDHDNFVNAVSKAAKKSDKAEAPATLQPRIVLASQEAQPKKDTTEAQAEAAKLTIGDKAPAITVEEWVKGEPVSSFEKGRTYVVEYWATWCGPCIAAIPHITETQKQYKDKVTVIGVAASEAAKDRRTGDAISPADQLAKVKAFVDGQGDKMGYKVAFDEDRSMAKAWLEASGQQGIPATFIVNGEGKVAWIGHPMEMDEPLQQIVEGKWDLAAAAAKSKKEAEAHSRFEKLMAEFQDARDSGDDEKVLALMDQLMEVQPIMAPQIASAKFKQLGASDEKKAYEWARKATDTILKDNAGALNVIAWTIVDPDDDTFENKDLDLALRAAMRADELTKHKDPAIIDTLAKVYFDKGDLAKAVELQSKAVALIEEAPEATRRQMEEELKDRLEEYKKANKGG